VVRQYGAAYLARYGAIDLQKMNWKNRPGFHEQTGVSHKKRCRIL
jgi:hypothetical protein